MLSSCGYTAVSSTDKSVVQMTKYKSNEEQIIVIQKDIQKGLAVIHEHLDNGIPIIVGVDHSLGDTGNVDETTDHWILIVGRKTDADGIHFLFFDPQTGNKSIGTSDKNRLTVQEDYTLKGSYRVGSKYEKKYCVTMVRPTKNK